jgi:hypothetical protein
MDWRDLLIQDDAGLVRIFREARTIAVLGAKGEPAEPAFYVPSYLKARGYRVVPVNPTRAGERILGETVSGTLSSGVRSSCRVTPPRSCVCRGSRRSCGFSSASATTRRPRSWRVPESAWCRIVA